MIRETDILDVCGSLVCFDERTRIVSLSHYSVKEYLTSPAVIGSKYFVHHPDASMELASVSIHCIILLSGELPDGLIQAVFELSDYATIHGFQHLTGCIPEENDTILKLLFALQDQVSDCRRHYETILQFGDSWLTEIPQLALYIIIRFGHPSLLRYYIDHHSVQITTEFNPLVHAASTGNVSCLQMLLDEGLDVNAEGMHMGRNVLPLTAAVERFDSPNCEDVVRLLITYGSRVPEDIVHSALRNRCHPSVIRILLEHGADAKFLVDDHNTWFHTSLKMRFRPGLEIARLLVGAGCDPTTLINRGNSVFHFAIQGGDLEFVQWLIEQGFQPPPDAALHLHHGHCHSMLRLLIGHGISVQVKDGEGNTPLHLLLRGYSRFQGDPAEFHVEAVQLLIGEGCNVNSKNLRGDTPLHLAAEKRMLNIIDYLIDQGAHLPVDIVNRVALSPSPFYGFRTSLMKYFTHLVKIHGASVQARTIDGQTALQCLLRTDSLPPFWPPGKWNEPAEEFLFLVDHGCDIHATTSSGVTLLQSAVVNGYATIVQYLLDRAAQLQVQAAEANGPLLELCSRVPFITEDEFIERVQLLQAAGYDVARHANTPNYRGFTPLQIVLAQPKHLPLAISHLLDIGAKFSGVKYLYLDNLNWASHLPWYHDAVQAHQAVLSRPKATSRDVSQVYHLLANHFRLPFSIARRVLDMAEYWAYESHVKTDVMCLSYFSARAKLEPILLLPINSGAAYRWMPRRLVFSWKLLTFRAHLKSNDTFTIGLCVKREDGFFRVPLGHPAIYSPNEPSLGSVGFCVWEHDLSREPDWIERKELAVEDLIVGDALIATNQSSYTTFFEFFQVEVYCTLRE
ncbi:ankyrin [Paxillus ammoniavirescens]|nr:ankyrin [Paxillus ammoniavirescens]